VISLPAGLSQGDQEYILQTIGMGTSFRFIDNPYPLGGYEGIEAGVSLESIPSEDISKLGSRSVPNRSLSFSRLSIGKGLYNNVDFFLSYVPYTQSTGLSFYGGALRWAFFQATFLPATFSLVGHGSSSNLNNQIFTQSYGTNVLMTLALDPFSVYAGGGVVFAEGQFAPGLTATGTQTSVKGQSVNSLFGVNIAMSSFFIASELDYYNVMVFSAKAGMRF